MTTASASAAQIRYKVETVEGTIPSGNPQKYRVTKESLNQSIESSGSQELRSDRQMSDSTLVSGSVGGALEWEFSFKTHDEFLEALLASTWVTGGTNGVTAVTGITMTTGTNIISGTGMPVYAKGQWFLITGHSVPALNGIYKCSDSVAPTATSIAVDPAVKAIASTSATQAFSMSSSRLKNGTSTLKTFSIEKEFSDVVQFFMMTGAVVKSAKLNFATGSPVSGSFDFMGRTMARTNVSGFPGVATTVAATTTPLINTVNATKVLLDGVSVSDSCAESFDITIDTGAKERRCLGSGIGLAGITPGSFDIKGSINIYFGAASSAAVYDKMVTDQPISFAISCVDANNNGYALTIERAKIVSSTVVAGGINTDVMMALEFSATIGTNSGAMLCIDRLGSIA